MEILYMIGLALQTGKNGTESYMLTLNNISTLPTFIIKKVSKSIIGDLVKHENYLIIKPIDNSILSLGFANIIKIEIVKFLTDYKTKLLHMFYNIIKIRLNDYSEIE